LSLYPLVFVNVSDPVGLGFVDSLAHPSANITGFTNFEFSIGGKWLELLKDMAPHVTRVGVVFNPLATASSKFFLNSLEAAAPSFKVELAAPPSHDDSDVERLMRSLGPGGGVIVLPDAFTSGHSEKIVDLANRHSLPVVYPFRFFVARGGLLSYGTDNAEMYRQGASYVDRILKGAKPSSLPVQAPTKFEMVVNLKTAKDLRLALSREFLFRADEMIE
jgi:putative tryptophan/tyrosine transport system substrate-binding protein